VAEPLGLPFSGLTPIARHHSAMAARAARESRMTKSLQYLQLLTEAGPGGLTDHETATAAGWPLSSVCSIRNGVVKAGLVVPAERHGVSPYGKSVTRWRRR